jgi:hypothetical protein
MAAATSVFAQGDVEPSRAPETPALAAQTTESGRTAYPVAFFADFNPNNAYELLQRVPGFTFSGGDSDVRGFAGAGGNVLIDGERPASKSVTLQDVLRRIPVTAIERVELVRAGDPTIDLQGQPLVANVVRRAGAGSALAVSLVAKRYSDGWIAPRFGVEASRQLGQLLLEGSVRGNTELDNGSGTGRRRTVTPAGVVLRDQPLFSRERGWTLTANGSATLKRPNDVFRLNAGAELSKERSIDLIDRQRSTQVREDRKVEVGGDYERSLSAALSGKVVALQTLGKVNDVEASSNAGAVEAADADEKTGESILRGSLTWRPVPTLSFEGGAEGAFNWLESNIAVTENGRPVPLPNDNVRIEERRAEGFVTGSWTLSETLSAEGALRVETSKISQSGDSALSRNFFFAKPRATLSYAPNGLTNVRLRFEREVGQLDFGDFAASSDLNLGSVSAGNARLEPERSWVAEAAFERRFWGAGAAVLTLTHAWARQVVDRLPINGAFDGPGNIGDGTKDQAKLTLALPLERFGIVGGRIAGEGILRRSKVTDPVTGEKRRISGESPYGGSATFTQDLPRLRSTWAIEVDFGGDEHSYRIDEVRRDITDPFWTVNWDWKPRSDLSIKFEVENVTGRPYVRERRLYAGARNLAPLSAIETRDHNLDPFASIRVRKAF